MRHSSLEGIASKPKPIRDVQPWLVGKYLPQNIDPATQVKIFQGPKEARKKRDASKNP